MTELDVLLAILAIAVQVAIVGAWLAMEEEE